MNRRSRVVHLVLFLLALVGINVALYGTPLLMSGDRAIWIHGGLLMVIIGMYWVEPFFTKPADAVINGLVAYIAISGLTDPPLLPWWQLVRGISAGLVIGGFVLTWTGDPERPLSTRGPLARVAYHVVTRLGSSRILFSSIFILALLSYFDLRQPGPRWLVVFWGCIMMASELNLEGLLRSILDRAFKTRAEPIGRLARFFEPNVIRFDLHDASVCGRGTIVGLTTDGVLKADSPLAVVTAQRRTASRIEVEALLVDLSLPDGGLERRSIVVRAGGENAAVQSRLSTNPLLSKAETVIGLARRNSSISRLCFEVTGTASIAEGHLVAARDGRAGDILFQVIDGTLQEEVALEGGERAYTVGEAEQLGTWNHEKQGFEAYGWVVSENAPVVVHRTDTGVPRMMLPGHLDLGVVPNSSYPVLANLKHLVLFHSAILGVTGIGKSFLAFQLIEECCRAGIKVICLDITGDYKRFLNGAVVVRTSGMVRAYLDSSETGPAICELQDGSKHPIEITKLVAEEARKWCEGHRSDTEVSEPTPKVLIVLEEAHVLVPEFYITPEQHFKTMVNTTAQIVLQARKYGLGFMVITQRTANVTKSILNQCNTIFAFQAYDETGFDFMKNYLGEHYVRALPNLRRQQCVLVGKASVSDRPVILRCHDQQRNPVTTVPREITSGASATPTSPGSGHA